MEQKINEIKAIFQAANIEKLPELIKTYSSDQRSGVRTLIKNAEKKLTNLEKEIERTEKMKEYEYAYKEYSYICGIDEVGRGPLAGPVVAGAVILPTNCDILYLNDSKQLSEKKEKSYTILLWKKRWRQVLGMHRPKGSMKLISCRRPMKRCARLSECFRYGRICS